MKNNSILGAIKITLVLLIPFAVIACFWGCRYPDYNEKEINNTSYYISKNLNNSFVSAWRWDGDMNNRTITILDSVDGHKIRSLGGYPGINSGGSSFSVIFTEAFDIEAVYGYTEKQLPEPHVIRELTFTIHLGKHISEIKFVDFKSFPMYIDENGDMVFVKLLVNIICPEDNKTFYSRDGRLYYRKNDELVDCFYYFNSTEN